MGIPVRKLQFYTACARVYAANYRLPVYLDAGASNEEYLHDPLYLGIRKRRPSSQKLYSFMAELVDAVQEVFPKYCAGRRHKGRGAEAAHNRHW